MVHLLGPAGAGKTSLILATQLAVARRRWRIGAIVPGDPGPLADAGVLAIGYPPDQCHLTPDLVEQALDPIGDVDVLFLENVPDLAWPPQSDLGQGWNVAVLPANTSETFPASAPGVLEAADLVLLTKTDAGPPSPSLLAALCDAGDRPILGLTLRTERGLARWVAWLEEHKRHAFEQSGDRVPRLARG